jgi:serine/threonine protein kinase
VPTPTDRLNSALTGRYRVERELGQGGMATVFLAHDLKHERRVAIKVLHEDLGATLGPFARRAYLLPPPAPASIRFTSANSAGFTR